MNKLKAFINLVLMAAGVLLIMFAVYGYALWTDASFDQIFQMINNDPNANFPMPLSVLLMIIAFPVVLLINVVMLFV